MRDKLLKNPLSAPRLNNLGEGGRGIKLKCICLERERENRCLVEIQSAPSPVCNIFSNLH